jgi:hypothetical protein
MKTTVKYTNVKYTESVREDGCKVIRCDLLAEVDFCKVNHGYLIFNVDDVYSTVKKRLNKNNDVVFHCTGTAVCSPADTYDFEIGRRLAYTRAQSIAFKKAAEMYYEAGRRFIDDLNNTVENCMRTAMGCDFHTYEIMYGEDAMQKYAEHVLGADGLEQFKADIHEPCDNTTGE